MGPVIHDNNLWSSTKQYNSGHSLEDKSSPNPSPEAIRLWAKFFRGVNQTQPNVLVLTKWMNFFTLLLLKQSSFDWAKDLLQSNAWQLISGDSFNEGYYFSLSTSKPTISISNLVCSECDPSKDISNNNLTIFACPQESATLETTLQLNDNNTDQTNHQSPSSVGAPPSAHTNTTKGKHLHISEDGLRRSNRIHNLNKGFKSCSEKEKKCCLDCESEPPTLSSAVVRNLGITFCNLKPDQLDKDLLMAKPSPKKRAVGRPKKPMEKKRLPPKIGVTVGIKGNNPRSSLLLFALLLLWLSKAAF